MPKFCNFNLTRPKTSNGVARYFQYLLELKRGAYFQPVAMRQRMTFQALREAGLIGYINKYTEDSQYTLTEKGEFYIHYVNSTNRPLKAVLTAILG